MRKIGSVGSIAIVLCFSWLLFPNGLTGEERPMLDSIQHGSTLNVQVEIANRKKVVHEGLAILKREFERPAEDRDTGKIKAILELASEFRAPEFVPILCANIDFIDPQYDPSLGSLKPLDKSYPTITVLQSIGLPAYNVILQQLAKEKVSVRKRLLEDAKTKIDGEYRQVLR
jgi:hypothetical protein